jgi:DnaJ-class molecular chaperone
MLILLMIFAFGCEVAPAPNPNTDVVADWKQVDCPRCKGKGQVYIDENHELHQFGYPVGWMTCDTCEGDKKMLTNGRGAYTRIK